MEKSVDVKIPAAIDPSEPTYTVSYDPDTDEARLATDTDPHTGQRGCYAVGDGAGPLLDDCTADLGDEVWRLLTDACEAWVEGDDDPRATLRVADVGGGDWDLDPQWDRRPRETAEEWAERVAEEVAGEVADCGGYDSDGPVEGRVLAGTAGGAAIWVYVATSSRALASRAIAIDTERDEVEGGAR